MRNHEEISVKIDVSSNTILGLEYWLDEIKREVSREFTVSYHRVPVVRWKYVANRGAFFLENGSKLRGVYFFKFNDKVQASRAYSKAERVFNGCPRHMHLSQKRPPDGEYVFIVKVSHGAGDVYYNYKYEVKGEKSELSFTAKPIKRVAAGVGRKL